MSKSKKSLTWNDLWALYWPYAQAEKNTHSMRGRWTGHIQPEFGDKKVSATGKGDIARFRDKLRLARVYEGANNRAPLDAPLTTATINRIVMLMKSMTKFGFDRDYLDQNYLLGIRCPKEAKTQVNVPEPELIEAIIEASKSLGHRQHRLATAVVYTLADSGMRIGEALSTRVSQVDTKGGFISLTASQCKSDEGRLVPLSNRAMDAIRELHSDVQSATWLFENHATLKPYSDSYIAKLFNAALLAGDLRHPDGKKIKRHDLRRFFCTLLVDEIGVDITTAMRFSGHKTPKVFTDHYKVGRRKNQLRVRDLWNGFLSPAQKAAPVERVPLRWMPPRRGVRTLRRPPPKPTPK